MAHYAVLYGLCQWSIYIETHTKIKSQSEPPGSNCGVPLIFSYLSYYVNYWISDQLYPTVFTNNFSKVCTCYFHKTNINFVLLRIYSENNKWFDLAQAIAHSLCLEIISHPANSCYHVDKQLHCLLYTDIKQ